MKESIQTTKSCSGCGYADRVLAKYCSECGERFAVSGIDVAISESRSHPGSHDGTPPQHRVDPGPAFETLDACLPRDDAMSKLTLLIRMNRAQLKSQGTRVSKANDPIVLSLMNCLEAPPRDRKSVV